MKTVEKLVQNLFLIVTRALRIMVRNTCWRIADNFNLWETGKPGKLIKPLPYSIPTWSRMSQILEWDLHREMTWVCGKGV